MEAGAPWVLEKVKTLKTGRDAITDAMKPLERIMGGSGAMYVMGKLPPHLRDDEHVARILVKDFGVAVIPGSYCGFPGWIRVCYANLDPETCLVAAKRLADGISTLVSETSDLEGE